MTRFREPLTRAAVAITGSLDSGRELADSLYSEMYGLSVREGERHSPLSAYSGRGSLQGFLRACLAQRNIDRYRRTRREEPLTPSVSVAAPERAEAAGELLSALHAAVTRILGLLVPEERFLLSTWFLDQRTLLEIARLLGFHEATVSRRIQRLTLRLHNGKGRRRADIARGGAFATSRCHKRSACKRLFECARAAAIAQPSGARFVGNHRHGYGSARIRDCARQCEFA
jgi:DNA-directed RNA polymerase specialized sigma24 family protein